GSPFLCLCPHIGWCNPGRYACRFRKFLTTPFSPQRNPVGAPAEDIRVVRTFPVLQVSRLAQDLPVSRAPTPFQAVEDRRSRIEDRSAHDRQVLSSLTSTLSFFLLCASASLREIAWA